MAFSATTSNRSVVATRSGSGVDDLNRDTVTSGWPSALIRSAARNSRSVIGSVEQRANPPPLAEVKYSGRLTRRTGTSRSIMKFAVCSISSTASRSPPSVIRGTPAVAVLPVGFARRSSILLIPLSWDGRRLKFVQNDADQSVLGAIERRKDVFQAIVDVEAGRQHRDETIGLVEQLAVGWAPGHRGPVEHHKTVAAGGTRLRDCLADRFARLDG